MPVVELGPLNVELQAAQKYMRISEGSRVSQQLPDLLEVARSLAVPRALYVEGIVGVHTDSTVEVNGVAFTSRVLSTNLESVSRVFPYVLTLGPALEARASKFPDLLGQYLLDTLGNMFLYASSAAFERHLQSTHGSGKLSRMNPGSLRDWPIEQQQTLFSLLGDVKGSIGVALTESFLMLPRKSTSGIVFPTEAEFVSCMLCPRGTCVNRKAAFDSEAAVRFGVSPDSDAGAVCSQ